VLGDASCLLCFAVSLKQSTMLLLRCLLLLLLQVLASAST
jgi:hypothetical protein